MTRFTIILLFSVLLVVLVPFILMMTKKTDDKEEVNSNEVNVSIPFIDQRDDLYKTAIFAGGCFWCIEAAFENVSGVVLAESGYTGGDESSANYNDVSKGNTNHLEAVRIVYNPLRVSYFKLLEIFFTQIDPTDLGGQFADRGSQYKISIFYIDETQKNQANAYIKELEKYWNKEESIKIPVRESMPFYRAEEYHQDYALNNQYHYDAYKKGSGRSGYIEDTWKNLSIINSLNPFENYVKPSEEVLRTQLSELSYRVTQEEGTERAFQNEYYDLEEPGIYVDIVSKEPLFSSIDKYESGTGWPSFKKPLVPENIRYFEDNTLLSTRVEVRSYYADSHLGHVFNDENHETGLRYCMNSAALEFVPISRLEEYGLERFKYLFD